MPKSSKPRKKYVKRPVLANPVAYAVESVSPLSTLDDYVLLFRSRNHGSMHALTHGQATKQDIEQLVAAYNMTEAIVRRHKHHQIDDETLICAKAALLDICTRYQSIGRYVCRAPEIQALNDLMFLADQHLEVITIKEWEDCRAFAEKLIKQGNASYLPPSIIKPTQPQGPQNETA